MQEPGGKKNNGSIVGFADGLFKKQLAPNGSAQASMGILQSSADKLNMELATHSFKQNHENMEVVPLLWGLRATQ